MVRGSGVMVVLVRGVGRAGKISDGGMQVRKVGVMRIRKRKKRQKECM